MLKVFGYIQGYPEPVKLDDTQQKMARAAMTGQSVPMDYLSLTLANGRGRLFPIASITALESWPKS